MNQARTVRQSAVLVALLLLTSVSAAQKKELEEALSYDGLQQIKVKGIDMAYARPGATLSGYTKVMIAPVTVAFRKDWNPDAPGTRRKLTTNEQEKIRTGVSKIVYDAFAEELKKGGYSVVTVPGPDVLDVRAAIINLYVTAPDVMTPGRSRTYTVSAGEMTLVAELSDSETGEILARVLDRHQARNTGTFTMSSSVSNTSEARSAASSWARILRTSLDQAKNIGEK